MDTSFLETTALEMQHLDEGLAGLEVCMPLTGPATDHDDQSNHDGSGPAVKWTLVCKFHVTLHASHAALPILRFNIKTSPHISPNTVTYPSVLCLCNSKHYTFNVHRSMHRNNILISNKIQRYTVYFIWKLLYMFRVVPSPIIRSYKQLYLQHLVFVAPLLPSAAIVEELEPV
jgi:hypothetical protein